MGTAARFHRDHRAGGLRCNPGMEAVALEFATRQHPSVFIHVADGIAHMLGVSAIKVTEVISVSLVSWNSLKLDKASLETLIEEATIKFKKLDQFDL